MTIKFLPVLDGDLAETCWQVYTDAFAPLAELAAQRHVMTRDEFDTVAADPRVDKVLTLDDSGSIIGVASFTRHLDAVPLISLPFYRRRWPQAFEQKRIWYIGFVAIAPAAQRTAAFDDLIGELFAIAAAEHGLVSLDVCAHNQDKRHLPRAIELTVSRLSAGVSKADTADTQSYWIFDLTGEHL